MKKKYIFFLINFIISFTGFAFLVKSGFRFEEGQFAYPLDDSFIHLAMAKNIALEGVWGVTSHEFSSTSSSPLFTLILAGLIKIFGNIHTLPLYLNALILFLFIYYLHIKSFLSDKGVVGGIVGLLITIIALPSNLTAMGMEHILQLLLVLMLVDITYKNDFFIDKKSKLNFKLIILIFLAVSTRFETIFVVGSICFVLLLNKQYSKIVVLSIIAFLPLIIYGIFSIANGSGFLPNSLLMKGNSGTDLIHTLYLHLGSMFKNIYQSESIGVFLFIPLLIQFILKPWLKYNEDVTRKNFEYLNLFVIVLFLMHYLFAKVGWLYRYENYVLMVMALSLYPSFRYLIYDKILSYRKFSFTKSVSLILFVFILSPFIFRLGSSTLHHYRAQGDIYKQHILIARFVRDYIKPKLNGRLAINDIGAISYYSDAPIFDVWGLANYEVTKFKHRKPNVFMPELFEKYGVESGIYHPRFFKENFNGWYPAGVWDIGTFYISVGSTVNFDAKNQKSASETSYLLKEYSNTIDKSLNINIKTFE